MIRNVQDQYKTRRLHSRREEEAIELALKDILKNSERNILDIGCGLGGTACAIIQAKLSD